MENRLNKPLEIVCWIAIVLIFTALFTGLGYVLGYHYLGLVLGIGLGFIIGVVLGGVVAEKTKKTIGCSSLFLRIFSSADIDQDIASGEKNSSNDK